MQNLMIQNELQQVVHILLRFLTSFVCEISDESGSDSEEEDSPNSGYSSLNDFVSEMRNSEICGEIRGKIFWKHDY